MDFQSKKRSLFYGVLFLLVVLLTLTSCRSETEPPASADPARPISQPSAPNTEQPSKSEEETSENTIEVDTSPVTLRIFMQQSLSDQDIEKVWIEPLKNKYPHIALEIQRPGGGVSMDSLIASGETPDIIYSFNGILPQYYLQDLLMDMSPLIKQHDMDLTRFDPQVMQSISVVSREGGIIALPFTHQFTALYYNKSLFDRFGVSYPKDGMLWDEAIDLAKRLSREDEGVTYAGLDVESVSRVARPLGAIKIDGLTDKATIDNEAWRHAFELIGSVYTIPNNERPRSTNSYNRFMKDQTVAMLATVNILALGLEEAMKDGLDWDLAQYPSYPHALNVGTIVDSHVFSITKTSDYKDQAMLALDVFTSEEVQTLSSRMMAKLTVLDNQEVKEQLGEDMPFLQGKHLEAALMSDIIASPPFSRYEFGATSTALTDAMYEFLEGKDLNTTLRELEVEINNIILSQQ